MTALANHDTNAAGAGRQPYESPDESPEVDEARLAAVFQALGSPIRLRLLMLVRREPAGEACFCDLADEFDMPPSSLSHHLKILVKAGVLSRERRGTWSWYRVLPEPLDLMSTVLRPGGPVREHPDAARRPDGD